MAARLISPPAWSLWIEGISNKSPSEFKKKPSRANMLEFFLRGIRERYHLKDDVKAKATAASLGLKLALSSKKKFVVYFRIEDIESGKAGSR